MRHHRTIFGIICFWLICGSLLLVNVLPTVAQQPTDPPESQRISGDLLTLLSGPDLQSAAMNDLLIVDWSNNRVAVRVTARDVDALLPALQQLDFQTIASAPEAYLVEGTIPIARLLDLEDLADQGLLGVVPIYQPITDKGAVTSQADFVHEADRVRGTAPTNYDGTGIRIGILSNSYNILGGETAGINSGDLPAAGVTLIAESENQNDTDEGRAMAELIHDLAPGASLAFATANGGELAYADNIRRLAAPAEGNADIIVDDVVYLAEPFFQDGLVAQAVDEVVTQQGVAYFASAGNRGTRAYESTNFNATPDSIPNPQTALSAHDFDPGPGTDTRQRLSLAAGSTLTLSFQWSDPFYTPDGVDTNLDLYLIDANTGNVLASSEDDNISNRMPFEILTYTTIQAREVDLIIDLASGPAPERIKYVIFNTPPLSIEFDTQSPTINPHAGATNAQAVAAVPYFQQDVIEDFSSRGPSTFLFEANGTPKGSPEVRQKPDLAAAQATDTTFFGNADIDNNGFLNFSGTSASAPHAAAMAALLKQANPSFTPQQIYNRLATTAIDIDAPGFDNNAGAGVIDIYDAIYGPVVPATLNISEGFEAGVLPTAWETRSTGNGRIFLTDTANPPAGSFHMLLATSVPFRLVGAPQNIFGSNEAILHVNTVGAEDVELSFLVREFDDEPNQLPETFTGSVNGDGVSLSVDGTNWYRLFDLTNPSDVYITQTINLSTFAISNSLSLTQSVRIKFQQFDDFPVALSGDSDGLGFDNITVTASTLNSAPTLDTSTPPILPAIVEDIPAPENTGTSVAMLTTGLISDTSPLQGIAVTQVDNTNGTWQYSLANGQNWVNFGSPSESTARLLSTDALVRFVPAANFNGTVNPGLQFRAWDQSSGLSGIVADTSSNGGVTAFSTASTSASITVTAVNDPPTVANVIAPQVAPFDQVFSFTFDTNTFTDVDAGDTLTYAATLADGSPLPAWLSFDATTRTFSGTPTISDLAVLSIQVTATDTANATATTTFTLQVGESLSTFLPVIINS